MPILRRKITLQTLTKTANGSGGTTTSWSNTKTIFGEVTVDSEARLFNGDQEYVGVKYGITCRWQSLNYTPPIENYRLILDQDGTNITLKILTVANPDLIKMFAYLTCIDNG